MPSAAVVLLIITMSPVVSPVMDTGFTKIGVVLFTSKISVVMYGCCALKIVYENPMCALLLVLYGFQTSVETAEVHVYCGVLLAVNVKCNGCDATVDAVTVYVFSGGINVFFIPCNACLIDVYDACCV